MTLMDGNTTRHVYLILFAELKKAFVTLKVNSFDNNSSSVVL